MKEKLRLKLYITGRTPRSELAVIQARRICDGMLGGGGDLCVIDVLERPDVAEQDGILATPTLVKESPAPVRRIMGDLSDNDKIMQLLSVENR